MAAAIPAAIGVGTSIASGIGSKGARKAAERAEAQRRAQLQPLIDAQLRAALLGEQQIPGLFDMFKQSYSKAGELGQQSLTDYHQLLSDALSKSNDLFQAGTASIGRGEGYLQGAAAGLGDLQKFYRPFLTEGAAAIDRFLPSKGSTESLLAPEFRQVNEGYQATLNSLQKAPRGGGRLTAFNEADLKRQGDLSDLFFKGRQALGDKALGAGLQAASGESNRLGQLLQLGGTENQLGLGQIGAGTSLLGTEGGLAQNAFGQSLQSLSQQLSATGGIGALSQGLMSGANDLYNLYNQSANRAAAYTTPQPNTGNQKGLGGFLVDLFNQKNVQDKVGGWLGGIFGGKKTSGSGIDWEGT